MTIINKFARHLCTLLAAFGLMLGLGAAQAQTVIYYHTDALGSPVATTNAAGVVIERTEYEPYGQVLNETVTDGPGYTGHVSDAQTGLSYMQQRYYDPQIGRFLSVDPMAVNSSTAWNYNRYNYAANNPYKYTDPDGRCLNLCTAAIGAGIGAIVGLAGEGYRQYREGKFNGRSLLVESGKGAVVGGLIGLTGGAAAASGLTLGAQAATTGSVALGVGAGAHAIGEVAKGNPAPSAQESLAHGYTTAAGAVFGTAIGPTTAGMTTTVIPAVSSHPVTSLSGKVFNTVNVPAQTITRPGSAEVANNVAGSAIESVAKRREKQQQPN